MKTTLLALALIGCGPTPETPVTGDITKTVVETPKPPPFDENAWRTDVTAAIDAYAATVDPATLETFSLGEYKLTDTSREAYENDLLPWIPVYPSESGSVVDETSKPPTKESAAALEAINEDFGAGLAYLELKDNESASRCMKALVKKGEWNAAAVIALGVGDTATLEKSLDVLHKSGQDPRVRSVVSRAIQDKKIETAKALATRYGWSLDDDAFADDLYATGDASHIERLASRELERWFGAVNQEKSGWYPQSCSTGVALTVSAHTEERGYISIDGPIDDILMLSKYNKPAALGLAKKFFENRHANVVMFRDEYGESPQSVWTDTDLAFYNLVKGDPDLKAKYLRQVHGWASDSIGEEEVKTYADGVVSGSKRVTRNVCETYEPSEYNIGGGRELIGLLSTVRKSKDQDLIAAWKDNLTVFSMVGYDTSIPRYFLGVDGGSLGEINPVKYGALERVDLAPIWAHPSLAMPTIVDDGTRFAESEFDASILAAQALGKQGMYDERDSWIVKLVRSGYTKPIPDVVRRIEDPTKPFWGTTREIACATAFELRDRDEVFYLRARGCLADAIVERDKTAISARDEAKGKLLKLLDETPWRRRHVGQEDEFIAPVLPNLREKAPEVFGDFLIKRAKAGDRSLFEAELKRMNAAGDADGVLRLTAMLNE